MTPFRHGCSGFVRVHVSSVQASLGIDSNLVQVPGLESTQFDSLTNESTRSNRVNSVKRQVAVQVLVQVWFRYGSVQVKVSAVQFCCRVKRVDSVNLVSDGQLM